MKKNKPSMSLKNKSEIEPDELHEHKTLDFLEYENDRFKRNLRSTRLNSKIKEKDEINNLDGWFKKNVKLKKEISKKKIENIV